MVFRGSASSGSRLRNGKVLPIILVVLLLGMLAAGLLPRLARSKARDEERRRVLGAPIVFTESVRRDTTALPVEVPGSVLGLHETSIYARSNGFVRTLRVDIGSVVHTGDTLITLDLPDIQQQTQQATALVEQADASAGLARATLARWKQMADKNVVTPQEFEEKQAAVNVSEAAARAARASLANLRETLRFGVLTAPFHGIVTARGVDVGTLVSSGNSTASRPLLTVVQTDTVRVMIQVPQSAAARVSTGMKTAVSIRELGDSAVSGVVARTAGAMDPMTRTLLTEVRVPNPTRRILPGMFSTVRLKVPNTVPTLRMPSIALIVRGDGPQVARVVNDTVHLTKVALGRDFGTTLEILSGVQAGDRVVVNPAENLTDGMAVKATSRDSKAASKPDNKPDNKAGGKPAAEPASNTKP